MAHGEANGIEIGALEPLRVDHSLDSVKGSKECGQPDPRHGRGSLLIGLAALACGLAIVALLAASLTGGDTPANDTDRQSSAPPVTAEPTVSSTTRPILGTPILDTLIDQQTVRITTGVPSPRFGDPGVTLCRLDNDDICTRLQHEIVAIDETRATVDVVVPRRFITWLGEIHDCVDVSPCQLRIWTGTNNSQETGIPVMFDATAALAEPGSAVALPTRPYEPGEQVTIQFAGGPEGRAIQCATQKEQACAANSVTIAEPVGQDSGELSAMIGTELQILTPTGPHHCISDGDCEVRFITSNGVFIDPMPLSFNLDADVIQATRAIARPAVGLADGDIVEVRVAGLLRPAFVAFLCAAAHSTCVGLGGTETTGAQGAITVRLPRFIPATSAVTADNRATDCAVDPCIVRISSGFSAIELPVAFEPDLPHRPAPEIHIDGGPYRAGDMVRVRGRDFATIKVDERETMRVSVCDSDSNSIGNCIDLDPEPRLMELDGTLDITIELPEMAGDPTPDDTQQFCGSTCWVVVRSALVNAATEIQLQPLSLN